MNILRNKLPYTHGDGLKFDGVNDVVTIPHNVEFNYTITSTFSINVIFRASDFVSNPILIGKYASSGSGWVLYISNTGILSFYLIQSYITTYYSIVAIDPLVVDTDYCVTVTKGTTLATFDMYVNGLLVPYTLTNTLTGDIAANVLDLSIGRFISSDVDQLNGIIFDIKIFNKKLTAAECLYLNRVQGQLIPSTATSNVRVDMRFSDKQGTIATDQSGNARNGTLTNFANTSLGASNAWVDVNNVSLTSAAPVIYTRSYYEMININVRDIDAQKFISVAALTSATQVYAIDTMVKQLKQYGLWTKMKAIYPFIGGTAASHKWNLKDARDLDAAYRLTFSPSGLIHSSTGVKPDNLNGYAKTWLAPSALNDTIHMSYYSRTDSITSLDYVIAASDNVQYVTLFVFRRTGNIGGLYTYSANGRGVSSNTITNSLGFLLGTIQSSSNGKLFLNNNNIETNDVPLIGNKISYPLALFGSNNQNTYTSHTNKECAFASIGDGLTDTDASNLYNIVQAYQTSLNRNV